MSGGSFVCIMMKFGEKPSLNVMRMDYIHDKAKSVCKFLYFLDKIALWF